MKILFVCTGNTCRSPMAEAIAKRLIAIGNDQYGDMEVASAGMFCVGSTGASPEAVQVAAEHSCNLDDFTSRQLTADMVQAADYIIVMGESHRQNLLRLVPEATAKIFLLSEIAADQPQAWYPDVADPYGGDAAVYRYCFQQLQDYIAKALNRIKNSNQMTE